MEVPPGPPALATLLAEVYGPHRKTRRIASQKTLKQFGKMPYIADVDNGWGEAKSRLRISIDRRGLECFGAEQSDVCDALKALLGGQSVGYSHLRQCRIVCNLILGQLAGTGTV